MACIHAYLASLQQKRIQTDLLVEQKQIHRLLKTYGYQRGQVGVGKDGLAALGWHMHTEVNGMIGQQGTCCIAQRTPPNILG